MAKNSEPKPEAYKLIAYEEDLGDLARYIGSLENSWAI